MATRSTNGGLIEIDTLRERIDAMRGSNAQDVSEDDVERAINSLGVLGAGFAVLKLGSRKLVQVRRLLLLCDMWCNGMRPMLIAVFPHPQTPTRA